MKLDRHHKKFQLNGNSFSSDQELLSYAHDFSKELYGFFETWFSKDPFILVNTSGSTGVPKEIMLQKEQMIHSAFATGKYFDLEENTTALLCLSANFIAGKMMLVRDLHLGWKLDVVLPDASPLKNIQKEYDFSAMVPLQLENSIHSLHLIKTLIVGGGVVSISLQQKIQDTSCTVFATYGMTETITHVAVKKLNKFKSISSGKIVTSYYEVLPDIEIYKDQRDCLVIRAPKISNNSVFTNDIVRLISDNQFEWLGRFDTVINSGGVKLHPERIEEKLSKGITTRFFLAGIPDSILGEQLILVVEGSFQVIDTTQLNLSKFEIPKQIYFVDEFAQTPTKKIARKKTLELLSF